MKRFKHVFYLLILDAVKSLQRITTIKLKLEKKFLLPRRTLKLKHSSMDNRDLVDTGSNFNQDNSRLQDLMDAPGKLSLESQAKVLSELTCEEMDQWIIDECEYSNTHGLDYLPCELYEANSSYPFIQTNFGIVIGYFGNASD